MFLGGDRFRQFLCMRSFKGDSRLCDTQIQIHVPMIMTMVIQRYVITVIASIRTVSVLQVMMLTIMPLMKIVGMCTLAAPSPESAQSRNHSGLIHLEQEGIDLSPGQPRQSGKRQKGDELG